jgi:hypothetical protein
MLFARGWKLEYLDSEGRMIQVYHRAVPLEARGYFLELYRLL